MERALLRNWAFDELQLGDTASLIRVVGCDANDTFMEIARSTSPFEVKTERETTDLFRQTVALGIWTGALIAAVIGTKLPGVGTIYLGQDFRFLKPVIPGDVITATVKVARKTPETRIVFLETTCAKQTGELVLAGNATVIAPEKNIEWLAPRTNQHIA